MRLVTSSQLCQVAMLMLLPSSPFPFLSLASPLWGYLKDSLLLLISAVLAHSALFLWEMLARGWGWGGGLVISSF